VIPLRVGCPIRRSRDHRSLASPPGFSQRATSFIASQCQGIHQMPLLALDPRRNICSAAQNRRAQGQDPYATRPHMKTLLRTRSSLAARAYPPRSHHNSLSSPFNQHPARLPGRCLLIFSERRTPPVRHTSGGGERDRTDDLLLAKQALSQLSYTPFLREWWAREDLNLRPHAYQARALTS
jgi:hypothetical protein